MTSTPEGPSPKPPGTYRSRPRPSLSQAEVSAAARALSEIQAGEMDGWTWREAEALDRARTKLIRALLAAEGRDQAKARRAGR